MDVHIWRYWPLMRYIVVHDPHPYRGTTPLAIVKYMHSVFYAAPSDYDDMGEIVAQGFCSGVGGLACSRIGAVNHQRLERDGVRECLSRFGYME